MSADPKNASPAAPVVPAAVPASTQILRDAQSCLSWIGLIIALIALLPIVAQFGATNSAPPRCVTPYKSQGDDGVSAGVVSRGAIERHYRYYWGNSERRVEVLLTVERIYDLGESLVVAGPDSEMSLTCQACAGVIALNFPVSRAGTYGVFVQEQDSLRRVLTVDVQGSGLEELLRAWFGWVLGVLICREMLRHRIAHAQHYGEISVVFVLLGCLWVVAWALWGAFNCPRYSWFHFTVELMLLAFSWALLVAVRDPRTRPVPEGAETGSARGE